MTNKASLQVFNSRQYGFRKLKQAKELGYITRDKMPKSGGGHYYIVNRLTDKGRKLLEGLGRS